MKVSQEDFSVAVCGPYLGSRTGEQTYLQEVCIIQRDSWKVLQRKQEVWDLLQDDPAVGGGGSWGHVEGVSTPPGRVPGLVHAGLCMLLCALARLSGLFTVKLIT